MQASNLSRPLPSYFLSLLRASHESLSLAPRASRRPASVGRRPPAFKAALDRRHAAPGATSRDGVPNGMSGGIRLVPPRAPKRPRVWSDPDRSPEGRTTDDVTSGGKCGPDGGGRCGPPRERHLTPLQTGNTSNGRFSRSGSGHPTLARQTTDLRPGRVSRDPVTRRSDVTDPLRRSFSAGMPSTGALTIVQLSKSLFCCDVFDQPICASSDNAIECNFRRGKPCPTK
ncbi:hypothetical protein SAMN02799631_00760 [Methylobacterium sp. 174MFSha1.1]|nr:hypothetical protein SAMN02799631_00760 [Methylobacterium sp. 174MFSha1.1]